MSTSRRIRTEVLGANIDALSWDDALGRIAKWAGARESRYVCICNVHSVVTARRDPSFRKIVNESDLATPDGMPVAWTLRLKGFRGQPRVNGPDLMWRYCSLAARTNTSVAFYGGAREVLDTLVVRMRASFPGIVIAESISPPFRELSPAEDAAMVERLNASAAGVVFVGLGCPRQERWIAEHRGRINAVMIGVGAAFDYHAGKVRRAPVWMQRSGLEWFYRLMSEPRRLWRRYLVTNVLFVTYSLQALWRHCARH